MDLVRLHVAYGDVTSTVAFRRFPIRLGREDTNDCRLDFDFVSRHHASIALERGHLLLKDEGSLTGTWVRGGQVHVRAKHAVDLGSFGNEFTIGALTVRVERLGGPDDDADVDDLLENLSSDDLGTLHYTEGGIAPESLELEALEASLRAALKRCAVAHQGLVDLLRTAQSTPPEGRKRLAGIVAAEEPEWDGRAVLRRFVAASGLRPRPARLEDTALHVLRELAAFYVPYGPPLASPEAVVEFAQRLDDLVSALVDGLEELQRSGTPHRAARAPCAARTRADRVSLWLDWTRANEGARALRAEFGRMAAAHREAIRSWLQNVGMLQPERIASECGSRRPWMPWQGARLWDEYVSRYESTGRMLESLLMEGS